MISNQYKLKNYLGLYVSICEVLHFTLCQVVCLSFSLRAIILLGITCSKVHFHTWNFPQAHQGTVQGSVHSVVTIGRRLITTEPLMSVV